ncbi:DNA recombination protein RmuC [Bacteriovoracaceae bacterium]|nr:DNA recombination protein RmuC [Bacteriovoracaceae bacterium]
MGTLEIIILCIIVVLFIVILFLIFGFKQKKQTYLSYDQFLQSAVNLNEKIISLQKQIEFTFESDQKERSHLSRHLIELNKVQELLKEETSSLVHVLNGNIKQNGIWGEVILEKILENSGLIEGQNYLREGKGILSKGEDGQNLKPDVIIMLPDNKNFIIDAKFPINAYRGLITEDHNPTRDLIKKFEKSIRNHINELSSKSYQNSIDGNSPLYTIMFFPIEAIYSFIQIYCPDVIDYAWKKNILLTTPQSLMGILKNSYSIWKIYQSHENSQLIAEKAGALYDKFSTHYTDLKKIQEMFDKLSLTFDRSLKQVEEGRGNLVSKVEELRELGAKNTKNIN